MTDPKTPAVEPRGPLSEMERNFVESGIAKPYFRGQSYAILARVLDDALRIALKERDEARRELAAANADFQETRDGGMETEAQRQAALEQVDTLRAKLEIAREGLKNAEYGFSRIMTADWTAEQMRLGAKSDGYLVRQALAKLEETK